VSTLAAALSEATEAFQTMLEGHRAHPDNDELSEDLVKAKSEMDVAWLNMVMR